MGSIPSFGTIPRLLDLKVGKWRDYIFGERVDVLLSLVAKSALAWQIFFGAVARN